MMWAQWMVKNEIEKTTHAPTNLVLVYSFIWTYWVSNRFAIVFFAGFFRSFLSFFVPYFFFPFLLTLASHEILLPLDVALVRWVDEIHHKRGSIIPLQFFSHDCFSLIFLEWNLIWFEMILFFKIPEKNTIGFVFWWNNENLCTLTV